ncbi:MAG: hypothetical protein IPJ17_15750 [Holophagales bacterium]|nr:MAG: hypothetical protein IPJ17_15750 [Holophagales bacterium]
MPSSFSPREPDATGMAASFVSSLLGEIRAARYPAQLPRLPGMRVQADWPPSSGAGMTSSRPPIASLPIGHGLPAALPSGANSDTIPGDGDAA